MGIVGVEVVRAVVVEEELPRVRVVGLADAGCGAEVHPEQKHLLQEVWGVSQSSKTNYLRVYMAQLRRKLETDPSHPRHLITEPGMGYRVEG